MRTSKYRKKLNISDKQKKIVLGGIGACLLAGVLFFFLYFKVENVEIMGSGHYTEKEIKAMVLRGPMAENSVLAPILYTTDDTGDIPFVEGFKVTRSNRNTIVVSVKEKKAVGCIPYLDSYIYFDRNGMFIESEKTQDKKVPFFDGIAVKRVVKGEKLPIKETVLNTAVALSTIFAKNDSLPDHIQFDESYEISLLYGDITVSLGKDVNLEDKMTRVIAILPQLAGQKGILHAENVTDSVKTITFEAEIEEVTAENWTGGYDENGEYTGEGEYDANWNYVGPAPTQETIDAMGDWTGGYNEEGGFTGTGEYDREGNYVGPMPENTEEADGNSEDGSSEDSSYGSEGEYSGSGYEDGYSEESSEYSDGSEETGAYDESGEDAYYGDGY